MLAEVRDRFLTDGPLDARQNSSDATACGTWVGRDRMKRRPQQNVNVFGHDDPAPQLKAVDRSRFVQRLDEPLPSPILRQQRHAAVAGEREKVWLTVVVVLHFFARRLIGVHRHGEHIFEAAK